MCMVFPYEEIEKAVTWLAREDQELESVVANPMFRELIESFSFDSPINYNDLETGIRLIGSPKSQWSSPLELVICLPDICKMDTLEELAVDKSVVRSWIGPDAPDLIGKDFDESHWVTLLPPRFYEEWSIFFDKAIPCVEIFILPGNWVLAISKRMMDNE